MSAIQGIVSVLGRLCLVTIFLASAVMNKIPNFQATVNSMQEQNIPYPNVLLPFAIVFLIVGGISVLVGYQARIGALLLAIFLILATYFYHDFWTMSQEQVQGEMIHFMKNVGLFGAMLFIIANGAGAWSLDAALAEPRPKTS